MNKANEYLLNYKITECTILGEAAKKESHSNRAYSGGFGLGGMGFYIGRLIVPKRYMVGSFLLCMASSSVSAGFLHRSNCLCDFADGCENFNKQSTDRLRAYSLPPAVKSEVDILDTSYPLCPLSSQIKHYPSNKYILNAISTFENSSIVFSSKQISMEKKVIEKLLDIYK